MNHVTVQNENMNPYSSSDAARVVLNLHVYNGALYLRSYMGRRKELLKRKQKKKKNLLSNRSSASHHQLKCVDSES